MHPVLKKFFNTKTIKTNKIKKYLILNRFNLFLFFKKYTKEKKKNW